MTWMPSFPGRPGEPIFRSRGQTLAMKMHYLSLAAVAVLGIATVRAQAPSDQSSVYIPPAPPAPAAAEPAPQGPPPPPPAPYYGYGYNGGYNPDTRLVGSITVPYAFNWNAAGVSAELGGLWMQHHFFGGEVSYYDGDSQRFEVFNRSGAFVGQFRSSRQITTVDFAYKYYAPLFDLAPRSPVTFYLGASGGVGFVDYSDTGAAFGFRNENNEGTFTGELVAGLQLNAGRDTSFRLGWRYVNISDVTEFDRDVDLDSSVLEAGVTIRF
jgi:hypothetical protein